MSYVAQILKGAKGVGDLPALPKPLFSDGARALSGALADDSLIAILSDGIFTPDLTEYFTTPDGNFYFIFL